MTRVPVPGRAPLATATAALLLSGAEAWACPSCFGRADGPLVDAARAGMWVLLGLTLALQAAFLAFFLYLRRRSGRA